MIIKQKYSLRKLSIGVVSCMLGSVIYFGLMVPVFAEETTPDDAGREITYGLEQQTDTSSYVDPVVYEYTTPQPETTTVSTPMVPAKTQTNNPEDSVLSNTPTQGNMSQSEQQPQVVPSETISSTPQETEVLNKDEVVLKTQAEEFIVTFDSNGGTGDMADLETEAGFLVLPENVFKYTGYEFVGWYVDGAAYKVGDRVQFTQNATVKATWIWASGIVEAHVGIFGNDQVRTDYLYPSGGYPNGWGGGMANWNGIPVTLYDENMNVIATFETPVGSNYVKFENLKEGKYYLGMEPKRPVAYFQQIGSSFGDILLTKQISEITVTRENASKRYVWRVLNKAYSFKTITSVGTFTNNEKEYVYFDGWQGTFTSNGVKYQSHDGILWGDHFSQYSVRYSTLEVPKLSELELAQGYVFVGWKNLADEKIYTTEQAMNAQVKDNMVFEAVWKYPTHTVSFKTNSEYGDIDGKSVYAYNKDFNNQLVDLLPTVTPKPGYEFVGWFDDLTTNVIPTDDILSTVVDKDLNFYAKFRKIKQDSNQSVNTITFLPGQYGTINQANSFVILSGSKFNKIPVVKEKESVPFKKQWKVIYVQENTQNVKEGDILTENSIRSLSLDFDMLLEAVYDTKEQQNLYTVIYDDGANGLVFATQVFDNLVLGTNTPLFNGSLIRDGYTFTGWSEIIEDVVTGNKRYVAQWKKIEISVEDGQEKETADNTVKDEKKTVIQLDNNVQTSSVIGTSLFMNAMGLSILSMIGIKKKYR